jgi:hypothetical protein
MPDCCLQIAELVHRTPRTFELAADCGKGLAMANGCFALGLGNLSQSFARLTLEIMDYTRAAPISRTARVF